MERRNDPYLSEALIKLLAETSDIDDESDDTDADKTYQPSREDLESSDSDCDLEKVIKEKSPVNLINCGDGDVLCQPSTSTEGGLQQVDVENSESVKKQKKFTKKRIQKKPATKRGGKKAKEKKDKPDKPKQQWKKGVFNSKPFPGPLDPSSLQVRYCLLDLRNLLKTVSSNVPNFGVFLLLSVSTESTSCEIAK